MGLVTGKLTSFLLDDSKTFLTQAFSCLAPSEDP